MRKILQASFISLEKLFYLSNIPRVIIYRLITYFVKRTIKLVVEIDVSASFHHHKFVLLSSWRTANLTREIPGHEFSVYMHILCTYNIYIRM